MNKEIFDKVLEIMDKTVPGSKVQVRTGDERIIEDLEFDSVSIMALLAEIESAMEIYFNDEMLLLMKLDTVNSLCMLVQSMVEGKDK